MHRVRGDHRPGQILRADAVQQRGEHGDLVGLGLHVDLPQHHPVRVVEGRQQVPAGWPSCAEPRSVLPSTATRRRVPGGGAVRRLVQAPIASSRASASSACNVRRKVDSSAATGPAPSPSSVTASASAAHSAIAAYERAPASTAHTATPSSPASR